jgi:branched-chain amino acid transport system permease protein
MIKTKATSSGAAVGFLRQHGLWMVMVLFLCIVPLILPLVYSSRFALSLLSQMGIAIIFALSYNMLLGQGGMLSFGHAAYYGLGGFIAMHAMNRMNAGTLPLPLELLPIVGGLGGLLAGLIFGWLSTARAGVPFALISLGIGELIAASALMVPAFFGGEEGISGNRVVQMTLTGYRFGKSIEVYYLIVFWMLLSILLMYLLTKTPLGRLANAVRDNPERAPFIGYDTRTVRTFQFSLAAFFAGIAGGLFAINYEIITAEAVDALASGNVLMMAYIGGIGHFFGPLLGAMLVTVMQLYLASITHAWLLYLGLVFVAMVLWAPNGLAGLIMMHEPFWKAGLIHKLMAPYSRAAATGLILFAGAMILIEIAFHISLSINPSLPMSVLGISFSAYSPTAWILSIALIIIGFALFRPAARHVLQRWQETMAGIGKGGAQ